MLAVTDPGEGWPGGARHLTCTPHCDTKSSSPTPSSPKRSDLTEGPAGRGGEPVTRPREPVLILVLVLLFLFEEHKALALDSPGFKSQVCYLWFMQPTASYLISLSHCPPLSLFKNFIFQFNLIQYYFVLSGVQHSGTV